MKIYGTADLHIGQSLNYGHMNKLGFPEKMLEQEKLLTTFVTDAIENHADMVILGGDYFPKHFRINPDAVKILIEQLWRLVDAKIPVKLLEGNHDKARIEVMASTIQIMSAFRLASVEVINKPCVKQYGNVNIIFIPHLIPAELEVYQAETEATVTDAMNCVIDELLDSITNKKPTILFGHFGISEAGRGSESTMIAGNNICIPASTLDKKRLDFSFLGHIHKRWKWSGIYSQIVYFGSLDRFDFAEAKDIKSYGVIEINKKKVHYRTVEVDARKFVNIRQYIGHDDSLDFLDNVDVKDAVVKVTVEVDKDFQQGKQLLIKIRNKLLDANAYYIYATNLLFKPTFVAKNAEVKETASVEDNLQRVLLDENFENPENLYRAHIGLVREIKAEDEADAES